MTQEQTRETVTRTAHVSESKVNATATLRVTADTADVARTVAKMFFDKTHGARASKIIVEEDTSPVFRDRDGKVFDVMVADHSSGSMADDDTFDFEMPVTRLPEAVRDGGDA